MRLKTEVALSALGWIFSAIGIAVAMVIFLFTTFETISANQEKHSVTDARLIRIEAKIDRLIERD